MNSRVGHKLTSIVCYYSTMEVNTVLTCGKQLC